MTIRPYRVLALMLSVAVLGWQFVNLALGHLWHQFLGADVIASVVLIVFGFARNDRRAAVGMFAGFAMFLGIFLSATTGALIRTIGFHPGTIAAGLGIVPGLIGAIGLGRRLARS